MCIGVRLPGRGWPCGALRAAPKAPLQPGTLPPVLSSTRQGVAYSLYVLSNNFLFNAVR